MFKPIEITNTLARVKTSFWDAVKYHLTNDTKTSHQCLYFSQGLIFGFAIYGKYGDLLDFTLYWYVKYINYQNLSLFVKNSVCLNWHFIFSIILFIVILSVMVWWGDVSKIVTSIVNYTCHFGVIMKMSDNGYYIIELLIILLLIEIYKY